MASSVNKVILIGNLGRDPEMRYTPDKAAVCNVSIATTSQWTDKASGDKREETEWHRVVLYRRLAEIAGEYLKRGQKIFVEGRLRTRKWQDKDSGSDRYSTEIIADNIVMLGNREVGQNSSDLEDNAARQHGVSNTTLDKDHISQIKRFDSSKDVELKKMDDGIPF